MTIREPYRTFFTELEKQSDEYAAEFDHKMRTRFEGGDRTVILRYIDLCLRDKGAGAIPDWVLNEFYASMDRLYRREIKSWDEVFGHPLPKGKQLATERRKLKLAGLIWGKVYDRHEAGESITKALFNSVGKECGVSGTVAAEIYYELEKNFLDEEC
jgi:hypothetical protein